MNPSVIECANCGATIGKLETPRVFNEHVVCAGCWERLSTAGVDEDPLLESIRREAVGYESKFDTVNRMRVARPTPVKSRGTSPIIAGRIIFGSLALLGVALKGRFGDVQDDRAIYAGINILWPSALIFLITFVKRAF